MKDFKTEEQAKKLLCPFMPMLDESVQLCATSQCMAWRWSHQDTGALDPPTGFCGAAGLPKYI